MGRLVPMVNSCHVMMIFTFLWLSSFGIAQVSGENEEYAKTMDPKAIKLQEEKLTHFHFYFHDYYSGNSPSAVEIVPPPSNNSATAFGLLSMIDDPLTVGPELSSKLIGRAQGFYGSASHQEISFILVMNLVFTDDGYNNSTVTILGSDPISSTIRELPVIGGSGIFRFARGYAAARTYSSQGLDAVVEYDVYVLHS